MLAKQFEVPKFAPRYQILEVKVTHCAAEGGRFGWSVRACDSRILLTGTQTYATEGDAFRAGNAAARAIRKHG